MEFLLVAKKFIDFKCDLLTNNIFVLGISNMDHKFRGCCFIIKTYKFAGCITRERLVDGVAVKETVVSSIYHQPGPAY